MDQFYLYFKPYYENTERPAYTFCEPVWASGHGAWCIRKTTSAGPKFGGGVDTPSLCGRVPVGQGWDMNVRLTSFQLKNNACKNCLEKYEAEVNSSPA